MTRDPEHIASRVRGTGMACLVAAFLIGGASVAGARTAPVVDGPAPSGDPTADDQPSPSPKQNRSSSLRSIQSIDRHQVGWTSRGRERLIWLSYVRVLIRISMK